MNTHRPITPRERAAYWRYIRENHPDAGGDPDAFAVGLVRLQASFRRPALPRTRDRRAPERWPPDRRAPDSYDAPVVFVPSTHWVHRHLGRLWRQLRRRRGPARVL